MTLIKIGYPSTLGKSFMYVGHGTYLDSESLLWGCNHSSQPLAKTKGVHREMESERRWRQSSGLTYRNRVRGS